jgi:hypothetical protein
VSKKSIKLRSECVEFLSAAHSLLLEKESIYINEVPFNGKEIIKNIVSSISSNPLHIEDIVPLVVSFREVQMVYPDSVYQMMLKKFEDVPSNNMPAGIYQYLLWCRGTPFLVPCFETIFAILESHGENLDIGECLALVKLALMHEANIAEPFFKYAKGLLKTFTDTSPFVMLLLMSGSWSTLNDTVKSVENYLVQLTTLRYRLGKIGHIADLNEERWPTINRILMRLSKVVQPDDEPSLLSLINLAVGLLKVRASDIPVIQQSQDAGQTLLVDLYSVYLYSSILIVEI